MEIARESIFVSALRSFCRMFFSICGIFLAIFFVSTIYSLLTPSPLTQEHTTLEILPDAKGNRELVSFNTPAILQIDIHGVIGEPQKLDASIVENILLDSRSGLLSHDRVRGILLHMNTPGGTVVDSDSIYRMIKDYKQKYNVPVFAYVEGLCASGGMYIACASDQVFAGPSSIIGSVGVIIGPFFNFYETLNKVGAFARTLTQGLDKDMMNPTRPWKEGEDAPLKAVTAFFYNQFVDIVSSNRPRIDKDKLVQEYGAKVFNPIEAQALGYVDVASASRNEALEALLKEAQIDGEKPYQVVQLRPRTDLLSQFLMKSPLFTGKIEHSLQVGGPQIRDQFAYLYQP